MTSYRVVLAGRAHPSPCAEHLQSQACRCLAQTLSVVPQRPATNSVSPLHRGMGDPPSMLLEAFSSLSSPQARPLPPHAHSQLPCLPSGPLGGPPQREGARAREGPCSSDMCLRTRYPATTRGKAGGCVLRAHQATSSHQCFRCPHHGLRLRKSGDPQLRRCEALSALLLLNLSRCSAGSRALHDPHGVSFRAQAPSRHCTTSHFVPVTDGAFPAHLCACISK